MSIDRGRFGRTLGLIALVSAVFLLTTAERFGTGGDIFPVAIVAVGSISLVTAMTGFLIAAEDMMSE
jgi:hypothetical protein